MPTLALPTPNPERIRRIPRSFGWVDHKIRWKGFLQQMDAPEMGLYFFLVLAADRKGLSCWRLQKIHQAMPCFSKEALMKARRKLQRRGLLAYMAWRANSCDGVYQLLSMDPPREGSITSVGETLFPLLDQNHRKQR